MLVKHPQPHRPALSAGARRRQPPGPLRLERLGLGRVFFCVGLARHLQDPAGFSQQRIHAAERERAPGARLDPGLRVLRPPEAALPQLRDEGQAVVARERGRLAALVFAPEQAGDPAGHKLVEVAKHGRAGDARRRRDLRGRQLVLRHQAQHQQALARPRRRVLPPRRLQLRGFRRPQLR